MLKSQLIEAVKRWLIQGITTFTGNVSPIYCPHEMYLELPKAFYVNAIDLPLISAYWNGLLEERPGT